MLVYPGDGIGKEVVPAGQTVLEALAASSSNFKFDFENFGWGGDWYRAHGEMMSADGLDALRHKDAILPGIDGPLKRCKAEDLDWIIVRENSEGEYPGVGGTRPSGPPDRSRQARHAGH